MQFIIILQLFIHQLLNGQLAELPSILSSFLLAQPYYRGGWQGVVGSHRVAGTGCVRTNNIQMVSIGAICNSTYHTKQLNLQPNTSASCQLTTCPGEMEPFKDHPSTRVHLTSLRNKSSLSNFQYQYLSELLVNVYSYHSMVKSVSCYCVRGSQLFSVPVTNDDQLYMHIVYAAPGFQILEYQLILAKNVKCAQLLLINIA